MELFDSLPQSALLGGAAVLIAVAFALSRVSLGRPRSTSVSHADDDDDDDDDEDDEDEDEDGEEGDRCSPQRRAGHRTTRPQRRTKPPRERNRYNQIDASHDDEPTFDDVDDEEHAVRGSSRSGSRTARPSEDFSRYDSAPPAMDPRRTLAELANAATTSRKCATDTIEGLPVD